MIAGTLQLTDCNEEALLVVAGERKNLCKSLRYKSALGPTWHLPMSRGNLIRLAIRIIRMSYFHAHLSRETSENDVICQYVGSFFYSFPVYVLYTSFIFPSYTCIPSCFLHFPLYFLYNPLFSLFPLYFL